MKNTWTILLAVLALAAAATAWAKGTVVTLKDGTVYEEVTNCKNEGGIITFKDAGGEARSIAEANVMSVVDPRGKILFGAVAATAQPVGPADLAFLAKAEFVNPDGTPYDIMKLKDVQYFLLYYAARGNKACSALNPDLIKYYQAEKRPDNFEMFLISWDNSSGDMTLQMSEEKMPWPAVQFRSIAESGLRSYVKYSVPCLVLVDRKGVALSHSARTANFSDPRKVLTFLDNALKGIPKDKYTTSCLGVLPLVDRTYAPYAGTGIASAPFLLLCFGAPAQGKDADLVREITALYAAKGGGENFEVIYIADTPSVEDLKAAIADMPWPAMTFKSLEATMLIQQYGITDLPGLVLADGGGNVILASQAEGKVIGTQPVLTELKGRLP